MSNLMLEPYVKTQTCLQAIAERQRQVLKGERGASALEYVGMILVAAMLVAAVVAGLDKAKITDGIKNAVTAILGVK